MIRPGRTFKNLIGSVVLKVMSPQITHKTDVGGVGLNWQTEAEITELDINPLPATEADAGALAARHCFTDYDRIVIIQWAIPDAICREANRVVQAKKALGRPATTLDRPFNTASMPMRATAALSIIVSRW